MALSFYVAEKLHDEHREEMVNLIPAGSFYLQTLDDMVARSSELTDFVLQTDTAAPVNIYINDRLVKTHIPKGERDIVPLPLAEPPSGNAIVVDNGIDAPVHLNVVATYMTTLMDSLASQIYERAGRITGKYFDLFTSPWASFIIEWLIPWKRELPDVRSFRSMSLKMAANTMFGENGLDGGVRDMVSVFTSTTPVVIESHNNYQWEPEIHQPYTSGDDLLSWDFHVWLPNLCLRRWAAFIQYINNTNKYNFVRADENVVMLHQRNSEWYQQHLFDNTGQGCSFRGLLNAMGCMDRLTFAGVMELQAYPSFCFWAHPFDQQVEYPGIGALKFFDSGTFDVAGHVLPDETNVVLAEDAYSLATAIALATEIRADYNAHDLDATPTWHHAAGGSYQITAAIPVDLPSLITFCIDAQDVYYDHISDATMHDPNDIINTLTYTITSASTQTDVEDFLIDFKHKFTAHQVSGNFDSTYDIDLLTDYWSGTSTSKKFDGGGCLDTYTDETLLPQNQECCFEGPDTKLLSTIRVDHTIESPVKPNHPIYGGDDPGILPDPYFGVLE